MKRHANTLGSPPDRSSESQRRDVNGKIHVQGEVEIHLPPEREEADAKAYSTREAREHIKQWVDGVTLFFVILVAALNLWQTKQSTRSADAAKKAADVAALTLNVQNRPWLKLAMTIKSPLTFNVEDVGSHVPFARMDLANKVENVGPSVAQIVAYDARLIPFQADTWPQEAIDWQNDRCGQLRRYSGINTDIVFPHDSTDFWDFDAHVEMEKVNNIANLPAIAKQDAGRVQFALVGCIVYRSTFEPVGAEPHETWFFYELGNDKGELAILPEGSEPKLVLGRFVLGNKAD